ncbi:hypothetical protein [Longimicrobium sp.]|nr:hypothetical protein [Longimicrobium sp.]HSU14527.1 hypothetical protein [Longimicrobium sp.]
MATTTEPTYPITKEPYPPTYCPACLSGTGPTDPNDPILEITAVPAAEG